MKNPIHVAVAVLVSISFVGCGGGGGRKAPQIAVATTSLAFSEQVIVEASSPQTITVSNTGNADLLVSSVSAAGTDGASFVLTNSCTAPVLPAASCSIGVSFKPSTTGAKQATLTILSNASGQPTVALTGTGVLPPPPTVTGTTITMDVFGIAATTASGAVSATDRYRLPLTYSISTAPTEGTATVASGGSVTYKVDGLLSSATKASDSFVVSVSNGYTSSTGTVNVTLRYDPLIPNQWHLSNRGQDVFSSTRPVTGNDMRVGAAWAEGVSGKGIKVAIVDDGLEAAHEDLKDNFELDKSFNFRTQGKDPTPEKPSSAHGTQVAGIVAASAFNGRGGRGVAYGATLRAYNFLENPVTNTMANMATGLGGGTGVAADNDIFNASFGASPNPQVPFLPTYSPAEGQTNATTTTLRGGRGAPLVESSGNSFENFGALSAFCTFANQNGVSCSITASDTRKASTIPIIVGALGADGRKSSYTTTGSSMWVSAPGGEYGDDVAFVPGLSANAYKPAIVTTTRTGCDAKGAARNSLDSKTNTLNPACQYTAKMNGTSAAAPNVSGVVALMLEARPQLTWRDVKFILAKTAVQVDPNMAPISYRGLALEQGWVRNAAGFNFNNWYGFGAVDAGAAVKLAKTHTLLPAQKPAIEVAVSPAADVIIPASTATTNSSHSINFAVSSPEMTVLEGVVFYTKILTGAVLCNQIELQSPAGTKSVLLHVGTGFTNTVLNDVRFATNAFYGEPVNGTWTMRIYNLCNSSVAPTQIFKDFPQTLLFVGR